MRAITVTGPGGPEVLRWDTVPDPSPGPGELLIEVAAAGVNRADLLQREGRYPPPPGASDILGLEASGTVCAVGDDVVGWSVGDRVAALLAGGGYAERLVVDARHVLPVPDGLDLVDAAGLPESVCTAWWNLVARARLAEDDTVLIHGGSGGVGSIAVQLATAVGAHVIATAGGPDRVATLAGLGVAAIDHHDDVAAHVADLTSGRGVDVILDVVGAGGLATNVSMLAPEGRLVVIGLQRGRTAELDLSTVLARRAWITGSQLRPRTADEKAAIVADVAVRAWPMLDDGRLRPVIGARVPMADAARAHELMAAGTVFGKIVLTT